MILRALLALVVLVALGVACLWVLGSGVLISPYGRGTPAASPRPPEVVAGRSDAQRTAALQAGVSKPEQILFGDLHVHTTYSFDAFIMSLPLAGGDGAHPVADACDYARYCAALDFWSINDHALASTPTRWAETVDAIRQCNAVAGGPEPDLVSYLGWEWTQVGTTPANHWGHKNVILRDLDDGEIPTRPIAALPPGAVRGQAQQGAAWLPLGIFAGLNPRSGGPEFARYIQDMSGVPPCPKDVPVRDLPNDCRDQAADPAELFAKLDDWGHEAMVIPHGTTWGFYTTPGSSWDKQLTSAQHDPDRQVLVEIMSGHGNSEEYRDWREVVVGADGSRSCPEPDESYLPSCWQAGEIIRERCTQAGDSDGECERRAAEARQNFVDADFNAGAATVPGYAVDDWLDSGQCRDCFQPAFNYRPRSSVQYMMALSRPQRGDSLRFRFGFMASSDNHSARPGTGYKEVSRREFTEQRFGFFGKTPLGSRPARDPEPRSERFDPSTIGSALFGLWETERQASFFLNGGLVAVHANGRDRDTVYEAMKNRHVYGTSGPRILLWFDLLNAPGSIERTPMGGAVRMSEAPVFEARAVGSFEQKPGCPEHATRAMPPERITRLCQDECYHPSDQRRRITRIEVVRIRPQQSEREEVLGLIDDPWRSFDCAPDPSGCRVVFSDDEFRASSRDALYYVRAIEEPSDAVAADPLGCKRDATGECVELDPCWGKPLDDDCLAPTEERAWSSPIFVDYAP
jgi:hypothetical protein